MTDFANMRVWSEEDATSFNPICLDDVDEDVAFAELAEKKKRRADKKKRRRRRKKALDDDSSMADSMLSSLLSESDEPSADGKIEKHMITVIEDAPTPQTKHDEKIKNDKHRRRERLRNLKAQRMAPTTQVQPMRESLYPSSDECTSDARGKHPFSHQNDSIANDDLSTNPYSDETVENDDLSKNPFSDENKKVVEDDDLSKNPFSDRNKNTVDDDDLSKNPFSDRNETAVEDDDDDLSKNPFSTRNRATVADDDLSKNPFADDSVRDRAVSDCDSEESSAILPPPISTYRAEEEANKAMGTNPFAEEDEEDMITVQSGEQIEIALQDTAEESSEEEDIIESSKRLLRCVDQRIQYQEQNEEVRSIKVEVKRLNVQAEAMAEQLRRAIETKCDLVLAQNEMERSHEQDQINKDSELRDLRLYIQEILEQQAKSELNFMNEIGMLARTLDADKTKHAKAIEAKDSKISQLETKIESMKVSSVRGTSPEAFRRRFTTPKVLYGLPSFE